jgi:hypothetical protein
MNGKGIIESSPKRVRFTGDAGLGGFVEDQYLGGPGPYSAINPNDGWLGSYPYRAGYSTYEGHGGGNGLAGTKTVAIARPVKGAAAGWPGLMGWMAANHPQLYNYVKVSLPDLDVEGVRSGASQLGYIGDDTSDLLDMNSNVGIPASAASEGITNSTPMMTSNWASQLAQTITSAGAAILPLVQQQKLLAVNVDRAAKGLPPVNISSYESATQGLNVGLNASTQKTLMYVAGGLALAYLASKVLHKL